MKDNYLWVIEIKMDRQSNWNPEEFYFSRNVARDECKRYYKSRYHSSRVVKYIREERK